LLAFVDEFTLSMLHQLFENVTAIKLVNIELQRMTKTTDSFVRNKLQIM